MSNAQKLSQAVAGGQTAVRNNLAASWTAAQTFDNSTVKVKGSSTGVTTFTSANAGASDYTFNLPAATTSAWISSYHHTVSGPTAARTFTYPDADMSVGYKNIPAVGTKTGSYSLAVGDVGKYVQCGSGAAITIPDATFAEGDVISLVNNTSGNITITCTITTAYISGTDSDKATVTLATRGVATIFFLSGTVCVISGNVS